MVPRNIFWQDIWIVCLGDVNLTKSQQADSLVYFLQPNPYGH